MVMMKSISIWFIVLYLENQNIFAEQFIVTTENSIFQIDRRNVNELDSEKFFKGGHDRKYSQRPAEDLSVSSEFSHRNQVRRHKRNVSTSFSDTNSDVETDVTTKTETSKKKKNTQTAAGTESSMKKDKFRDSTIESTSPLPTSTLSEFQRKFSQALSSLVQAMSPPLHVTPASSGTRPVDNADSFHELITKENGSWFVDKSLLIKEFLESEDRVTLIERPRKWGKTVNLDMLRTFLESEVHPKKGEPDHERLKLKQNLFVGIGSSRRPLKISRHPAIMKQLGQHPVVHMDFSAINGTSYNAVKEQLAEQITRLYTTRYLYLKRLTNIDNDRLPTEVKRKLHKYYTGECESEQDIKESLGFLSEILYRYFHRKAYVLIDKFDWPTNRYHVLLKDKLRSKNENEADSLLTDFRQTVEMFRAISRNCFNENPYVEKGLIMGTLHLPQANNIYSDVVDLVTYNAVAPRYSEYYGFSREEVVQLLATLLPSYLADPEQVRYWYEGYGIPPDKPRTGDRAANCTELVYSPWSIMQYVKNRGLFDCHWLKISGSSVIRDPLLSDYFERDLYAIIAGNTLKTNVSDAVEYCATVSSSEGRKNLLSLLLHTGYLTVSGATYLTGSIVQHELKCPNEEVSFLYENLLKERIEFEAVADEKKWYSGERNLLVDTLLSEEKEDFRNRLDRIIVEDFRCDQTDGAKVNRLYQIMLVNLFQSEHCNVISQADDVVILEPNEKNYYETAAVIKIKTVNTTCNAELEFQSGINAIEHEKYTQRLKRNPNIGKILNVCLLFNGIEIWVKYRLVRLKPIKLDEDDDM